MIFGSLVYIKGKSWNVICQTKGDMTNSSDVCVFLIWSANYDQLLNEIIHTEHV